MGTSRILAIATLAVMMTACNSGGKPTTKAAVGGGSDQVVATVNGSPITDAQLTDAVQDQLKQFDMQVYKIKKGALDELVETKLIEDAAKKEGKSVEDYVKVNIDDKIKKPGEAEVKAFYESNKDRMGGKTFDEMKATLTEYLGRQASAGVRGSLLAQLRKDAKVTVSLEPPRANVDAGDNPSRGPKSAPVTLIEFTDYQCPFCGRVRPTITQILDQYKDKVRYVLRDYPLPFHGEAKKAHEAAHCAGEQGKYWEMSTLLFKNQQALGVAKLKDYAKEVGLNQSKFDKCLDSGKYAKKVDDNQAAGSGVGVNGTPAFFVNGVMLSGAQPIGAFTEIIDAELANKK